MKKIILLSLCTVGFLFAATSLEVQKDLEKNDKNVTEEKVSIVVTDPLVVQKRIDAGKKLYTKCISCHGTNAEKKALNKSIIIKGWTKGTLIESMNGYKDGTYGGPMKTVMKQQIEKYTTEEIESLAGYISSIK